MNERTEEELIAKAAEDGSVLSGHLEARRLQIAAAIARMKGGFSDAPAALLQSAYAIAPKAQPVIALRTFFQLGMAGARSAATQRARLELTAGGVVLKLDVEQASGGVQLMGRFEGLSAQDVVCLEEQEVALDEDGYFEIETEGLPCSLRILTSDQILVFPVDLSDA